ELGLKALCLFDRDYTLIADLLHGFGQHAADLLVAISRDGPDLSDLVVGRDLFRSLLDVIDHGLDRVVYAALQIHRVEAGGDSLDAFADDGLRQDGCGGRAVAGLVAGLARDFSDHLRAHILELVGELDFLGDGDAIRDGLLGARLQRSHLALHRGQLARIDDFGLVALRVEVVGDGCWDLVDAALVHDIVVLVARWSFADLHHGIVVEGDRAALRDANVDQRLKVSSVMTRDVQTIDPNSTLHDAAELMQKLDTGALPVGGNDRLVGMITDRDIAIRGVGQGKGPDAPV